MSEKTKIVVIHMKELLYTIIFTVLIIILVIVLVCMFLPQKEDSPDAVNSALPTLLPEATEELISFD